MASTRLSSDTCAYKKRLLESTGPLNYSMYTGKYENCTKCRVEFGTVGGNGVSLFSGNLVDLESDLRGQTRPASLCPSKKYQPNCTDNCCGITGVPCDGQSNQLVHQPACQMFRYPQLPQTPQLKTYKCDYQGVSSSSN